MRREPEGEKRGVDGENRGALTGRLEEECGVCEEEELEEEGMCGRERV